jgi:hypothetical protein
MEDQNLSPLSISVHAIYGAIYQDGEFVQRGAVLGLSVDAREVVIAPVSGWVRLLPPSKMMAGIGVEILQQPADYAQASSTPDRRG